MRTYEETLELMNDFANGVVQLNKMSDSDLSNIIVALEKQIPKEPIYQLEHEKCPACGSFLIEAYCTRC